MVIPQRFTFVSYCIYQSDVSERADEFSIRAISVEQPKGAEGWRSILENDVAGFTVLRTRMDE